MVHVYGNRQRRWKLLWDSDARNVTDYQSSEPKLIPRIMNYRIRVMRTDSQNASAYQFHNTEGLLMHTDYDG